MPTEPVFENFSVKEKAGETVCRIKVECKTDVPSEAVEKILNDGACVTIAAGAALDGRAEFTGRATFFVCYVSADGIKKCECGAEIKDAFVSDAIAEGDAVKVSWTTEKTEVDLSGLKASVSAFLTVKGEFFRKTEYAALTGGDGIYCDLSETRVIKSFGAVNSVYSAEEEFELPFAVAEVMSHRAEACVTAVQCGVGSVICDGEIYLTEILLQSGEKNDIIRKNEIIPFRAEIECEDAMPTLNATCRAFVKSLKTDIGVDEEKNISTLTAKITVGLTGEAFADREETFATDAFSTENQLTLTKKRVAFSVEKEPFGAYARLVGRAETEDTGGARIVAVISEKAEVASAEKKDGKLAVSGALTFNVLMRGEDGVVFTRKAETPFETEIACDFVCPCEVVATPKSATAKLLTLTEMETEAEVVFTVYPTETLQAEIISAVETGEQKVAETAAVSVYIPLAGEGLWGLSKRLNVCPETLIATNGDLQFPLTGKERIVVYRQK